MRSVLTLAVLLSCSVAVADDKGTADDALDSIITTLEYPVAAIKALEDIKYRVVWSRYQQWKAASNNGQDDPDLQDALAAAAQEMGFGHDKLLLATGLFKDGLAHYEANEWAAAVSDFGDADGPASEADTHFHNAYEHLDIVEAVVFGCGGN